MTRARFRTAVLALALAYLLLPLSATAAPTGDADRTLFARFAVTWNVLGGGDFLYLHVPATFADVVMIVTCSAATVGEVSAASVSASTPSVPLLAACGGPAGAVTLTPVPGGMGEGVWAFDAYGTAAGAGPLWVSAELWGVRVA